MLDFRIDTFLEVCRLMNFTKAAEELNITQPAVSQHIHYLEEMYGVKLFDYKTKKLRLTAAGKVFLNAATTMKHDDIYLRQKLMASKTHINRLTFGASLSIGQFVLPSRLAAFLNKRPDTEMKMIVANTGELLAEINRGHIDFALVEGFFEKSEYDYLTFSSEKFIAVCGASYPFKKIPQVIEDILEERIILREAGSGSREILEKYIEGRNFTIREFRKTAVVNNIKAIKSLAEYNCGVTFLYEAAVREELETGRLVTVALEDFPLTHDFNLIWRKNSIFADQYQAIFELLKKN